MARWTTACARLSCASGRPTNSTARAAASATTQAHRVGHADVLAGQDHQPAGDEAGVLPRFEHAGQPVEAGVGIGAADALDERADDVVVVVAAVAQRLGAEGGLGVGQVDVRAARRAGGSRPGPPPPRGWSAAGGRRRSARSTRWSRASCVGRGALGLAGPARPASPAPRSSAARGGTASSRDSSGGLTSKYGFSVVAPISTSRPSSTDGSSASCWALLKRWISSRNRIVPWPRSPEAVGGPARSPRARPSRVALTADSCSKALCGRVGDEPGQRRLAGARRAPEDHRRQPVGLDQRPQRPARGRAGGPGRRRRRACAGAAGRRAAPGGPAAPRPPPRTGPRSPRRRYRPPSRAAERRVRTGHRTAGGPTVGGRPAARQRWVTSPVMRRRCDPTRGGLGDDRRPPERRSSRR